MELASKFPGNPLFHGETSHEDNAESEQQSRGKYAGRSPANTGALQARFTESSLAGREYEKKITQKTQNSQTAKKSKKVRFSESEPEKEIMKKEKEEEIEFPWMLFILFLVILYAVYFFYKYQSLPSSSSSDLV